MTSAGDVLSRASRWVGTVEQPVNRVPGVTDWYGLVGPWCAMWVSKVFHDAGLALPATTSKGFAYTPSGVAWFKSQHRWYTSNPQPGDVVFFDFPGDGVNRVSHVGIVESVDGSSINTIEGNTDERGGRTGGKVMRRRRRVGIVGYGRPAYDGSAAPAAPAPPPQGDDTLAWPTVQQGSKGHHARIVQALLVAHADDLVGDADSFIDGDFGQQSVTVLKTWQKRTGVLADDGVCGPRTWRWLSGAS